MSNETPNTVLRLLTVRQIKILQECYTRELTGDLPISTYYSQSAKGLYERGLLRTVEFSFNDKSQIGFSLTDAGKEIVKHLIK